MADNLKSTFEKYQFYAFTILVGAVMGFYWNSQAAAQKDREETRREVATLSRQMAIVITKGDNSDYSQRLTDTEIKEINKRLGSLERDNGEIKQQLRQLNK